MKTQFLKVILASALTTAPALAQDVAITPDQPSISVDVDGTTLTYERNQDQEARIEDGFAKTSRACPPFCIHPMSAGEGVETVGELELIGFVEDHVAEGTGYLIDSRIPDWHAKGTIPGAINIPFTTLSPVNAYRDEILKALGGRQTGDAWDFADAADLLMFCNGPWCDQSPRAISYLLDVGYPAEKMRYYRGGMQNWLLLGLNVVTPESQS